MTKTVALSEAAYEILARLKQPKESFSEIVLRLSTERKKSLRRFVGIWGGDDEITRIYDQLAKDRQKHRIREVHF